MKKIKVGAEFEIFILKKSGEKEYLDTGIVMQVYPGCATLNFPKYSHYITISLTSSGRFNRKKQPLKGLIIQPIGETELSPSWNRDNEINEN